MPPKEQISALPKGASDVPDFTLLGLMAVLLRNRWRVVGAMVLFMLAALAIIFLRPRTYTTTFSIVPQANQDDTRAGLSALAGQFGLTIPTASAQTQSPQMYVSLLTTREILTPIALDTFSLDGTHATRTTLTEALEIRGQNEAVRLERTLRALRRRVVSAAVADRTTGVVNARVRTMSPVLSLDVAERLIDGLHRYNVIIRQSQATEERRFVEDRLSKASVSLRAAEDSLEAFLASNRRLENSPELTFQRDRMQREVSMQEQIALSLAQQFEEARIREVRATPVITVIEKPTAPALPDGRGGTVILAVSMVMGLFVGAVWAVVREELARVRSVGSPDLDQLRGEWARARGRA